MENDIVERGVRYFPKHSHSIVVGYVLWIFGFMGAHRLYYGKPVSGTIYFFTFGLLGVGWLIDLVLIPAMNEEASYRYVQGPINYSFAWILLAFGGFLGLHRFYQGKILSGLIYLLTSGLFFFGVLYDYWFLNESVDEVNSGYGGF